MLKLAAAFALTTLSLPALAQTPDVLVATNPERAWGYGSLAECEKDLGGPAKPRANALAANQDELRGSLFNRRAGNISRCEMVDGEALIVVYPRGHDQLSGRTSL